MSRAVVEYILLAVSLLVTAAVIWMLVTPIAAFQGIGVELSNQQVMQRNLKEYEKYNQFDGKSVYPQDIIGLVLTTHGGVDITIKESSITVKTYNYTTPRSDFTVEEVSKNVKMDKTYQCTVVKDINSVVSGVEVVMVP